LLVIVYAGFDRIADFLTQETKPAESKPHGRSLMLLQFVRFFSVFYEEYARIREHVERERRLETFKPFQRVIHVPVLIGHIHVICKSIFMRFKNSFVKETKASNPETYSRITIAIAVTRVAILCAALGIHGWANISELFGHVDQGDIKRRLDWRTSVLVPALMTAALLEVGSTAKKMLNFARDMAAKALFEQELNVGREVQSRMLPNLRTTTPSWHWRAMYLPAEALAGDWFDIREIGFSDGRTLLAVCVADVTGHGVGSSLATSVICSHWGLWCARLQAAGFPETPEAKQQELKRAPFGIHRGLKALRENENCTAIFALFDPTRNEITFSSAGHPGILVIGKKAFRYFTTQGERLGGELSEDVSWNAKTDVLNADDLVVLYSDGVVPLRATVSSWAAQIKRKVNAGSVEKPELMLVNQLRANKLGFVGAPDLKDDMTLVMVRRNTESSMVSLNSRPPEESVATENTPVKAPDIPASA
jgi:serine phosphatase RsbU (regulator of sigma subunit)